MCNSKFYGQIINNLNITLENENFKVRNIRDAKCFIRDRVFTFKRLIIILMTQLQRSFTREINDFLSQISDPDCTFEAASGAAFTKARAKLKHTAFIELSDQIIKEFYACGPHRVDWKGFRVIACDGSKVELPNSEEIRERFGIHSVRSDGKEIPVATICELFDPLNNLCLASKIDGFKISESELAWEMLREGTFGKGDIFVFDRYFYSSLLVVYLNKLGADFCFRLKANSNLVKSLKNKKKQDDVFEISIGRESNQRAELYNIPNQRVNCRVTIIDLPNGQEEFLLSSFTDQQTVSSEDLKQLYFLRWRIEEQYKKLKHKVCLENFSGKTVESIFQDFYVKIFTLNLTCILIHPVDRLLEKTVKKKHVHKVNFTNAIARIKYLPIKLFIEKNIKVVKNIMHWFLRNTIPIRPGRTSQRHKIPKRKYPQNYKPA